MIFIHLPVTNPKSKEDLVQIMFHSTRWRICINSLLAFVMKGCLSAVIHFCDAEGQHPGLEASGGSLVHLPQGAQAGIGRLVH